MAIQIEAFANSDDAFIAWRSPEPIADCVGFELRRKRNGKKVEIVRNRISFSGGAPDPTKIESSKSSPLRRYTWTDHEVNTGDKAAYQVAPVIQTGNGDPETDDSQASPFSKEITLTGEVSDGFECYFNRGFVISQFMSRFLKGDLSAKSLAAFKKSLNEATENKIRVFLGGDLRARLLALLDEAKQSKGHIFAALYELSDEILIERLKGLGQRAHIVLSNGSHSTADDDGNADARQALTGICDVHDRMLPANVLGHNKFMVLADKDQKPLQAWSGSTNWSPTGLCTQINNGILVKDAAVAGIFLEQWNRLSEAGNKTPKDLVAANDKVKPAKADGADLNIWFTRTSDQREMDQVVELINGARQGILFLMFMPGKSPMLDAIVTQQADNAGLFVKGVVSTLDKQEMDQAQVTLIHRGGKDAHKFRIVQPVGLHSVGKWAAEVSRGQFLNQVGFAIVHSKVIVIDPNGDKPVVITGSHNFSASASGKNDENLIIIEGNAALAKAYAVECQAVFDHYNFRAVAMSMQAAGQDVTELMKNPKSWQPAWFQGDKALELAFWLGSAASGAHH